MVNKRGAPRTYTGKLETYIVSLLRKHHNATKVRLILNAPSPRKGGKPSVEFAERNLTLVPKALGITPPTIGVIAKRHKIVLPKGRPVSKAA